MAKNPKMPSFAMYQWYMPEACNSNYRLMHSFFRSFHVHHVSGQMLRLLETCYSVVTILPLNGGLLPF